MVVFCIIALGYMFVISELAMYVSLFSFLNKHDRSMRTMLSENVIKGRLKKNAIDSAGHAINFAIELLLLIIAAIGGYWTPDKYRWLTRCFTISTYGILSAIHILAQLAILT